MVNILKITCRHNIVKLLKLKAKRKISNTAREKYDTLSTKSNNKTKGWISKTNYGTEKKTERHH